MRTAHLRNFDDGADSAGPVVMVLLAATEMLPVFKA
jgi:hypothetical protein